MVGPAPPRGYPLVHLGLAKGIFLTLLFGPPGPPPHRGGGTILGWVPTGPPPSRGLKRSLPPPLPPGQRRRGLRPLSWPRPRATSRPRPHAVGGQRDGAGGERPPCVRPPAPLGGHPRRLPNHRLLRRRQRGVPTDEGLGGGGDNHECNSLHGPREKSLGAGITPGGGGKGSGGPASSPPVSCPHNADGCRCHSSSGGPPHGPPKHGCCHTRHSVLQPFLTVHRGVYRDFGSRIPYTLTIGRSIPTPPKQPVLPHSTVAPFPPILHVGYGLIGIPGGGGWVPRAETTLGI